MAQLTIYLPKETERKVKAGARKARTSVSAYIAKLVEGKRGQKVGAKANWPKEFLAVLGTWKDVPPRNDDDLLALDEPPAWR
jgi:hypothetical protein